MKEERMGIYIVLFFPPCIPFFSPFFGLVLFLVLFLVF